jgi:high-affinity iron transporter
MGAVLLIVFRESLEAAIVIGILVAFAGKAGLPRLRSAVWTGALLGLAASLLVARLFLAILGEFEGRAEQLFEATVMILGAGLLTALILWLHGGSRRAALERQGAESGGTGGWIRIALLVFVSVLREGVETVIFLGATLRNLGPAGLAACLAGLGLAALVGLLVFGAGSRLKLRRFFTVTNGLLLLFAAGLVGRAAGELGEAGLLPPLVVRLWDLNPILHEEGAIGSLLRGLFGYSASPSLTMLLAYLLFLAGVSVVLIRRGRAARRPAAGG